MIAPERAAAIAQMLRDDGLPDSFNRWLGAPADFEKEIGTMISIKTNAGRSRLANANEIINAALDAGLDPDAKAERRKAGLGAQTAPATPAQASESDMQSASATKIRPTDAKNRKEPGARPAAGRPLPTKPDLKATTSGSGGKPKNKTEQVDKMLTSKLGATREQMSNATGWASVNLRVAAQRRPQHVLMHHAESDRFRLVPSGQDDAAKKEGWKPWKI